MLSKTLALANLSDLCLCSSVFAHFTDFVTTFATLGYCLLETLSFLNFHENFSLFSFFPSFLPYISSFLGLSCLLSATGLHGSALGPLDFIYF